MKHINPQPSKINSAVTLGVIAAAVVAVFLSATSSLSFGFKALAAIVIFAGASLVVVFVIPEVVGEVSDSEPDDTKEEPKDLIEELTSLEDAASYFSASMEPFEMLRLISARLENIVGEPVHFFLQTGEGLSIASRSNNRDKTSIVNKGTHEEVAINTFASGRLEKHERRDGDGPYYGMPVKRGDEVIAVFTVRAAANGVFSEENLLMIRERIEPLVAGSLSFASSVSNALTDGLTNLPNERAMHLILENQVAEAQRFGNERPLTVVAIDIDSFDDINKNYGHSVGDRLLEFTGILMKDHLRKMDFLARISGDEFILILPTAEGGSADTVIERIRDSFGSKPFDFGAGHQQKIGLSFGRATFGEDGETGSELIIAAKEKKHVGKSLEGGSVIQFPKTEQ